MFDDTYKLVNQILSNKGDPDFLTAQNQAVIMNRAVQLQQTFNFSEIYKKNSMLGRCRPNSI
jgi:hypothetical protein